MEIIQLPKEIIARISAGEVIKTPYNAIKELLENALDAEATHISIYITSTLIDHIEIVDNGKGISDFELLGKAHCTSKLRDAAELDGILTYGFRGEALYSISQCGELYISSRHRSMETGTRKDFTNGKITKIAMQAGTRVEIRNLFYNNKIRQKYYYQRREEINNIYYLIMNYWIYNSEKRIELFLNGKNLCVEGNDIEKVYKTDALFSVEGTWNHNNSVMEYSVLYSQQGYKKYNFILFVNNRLVVNMRMKEALYNVFKHTLPQGRYPFLFIKMKLNEVDINVHPTKNEVLIGEETEIIEILKDSLRNKIGLEKAIKPKKIYTPNNTYNEKGDDKKEEVINEENIGNENIKNIINKESFKKLIFIGQFNQSLIILQSGADLLLCDLIVLLKEYKKQSGLNIENNNLKNAFNEIRTKLVFNNNCMSAFSLISNIKELYKMFGR
ncbi:DNA mismatch repair protein MutL [Astathelohania contejeani]|uniref:DNA mismatch repair protein MutL n=1 Tax=Astathelohania contejeani TaxID=164912 RepID=A0ABQ7I2R9_9MICR|nr:DNA mismatch repair protein MutL [Thelohania contejeani]